MTISREQIAEQVALLLRELDFWLSARRSGDPIHSFVAADQLLLACADRKLSLFQLPDRMVLEFLGADDDRRAMSLSITEEAFTCWPLFDAAAMTPLRLGRAVREIERALLPYAPPHTFMIGNMPEALAPGDDGQALVGAELDEGIFTLGQLHDLLLGEATAMNLDHDVDLVVTPPAFACPADVVIDHSDAAGTLEVLSEDDARTLGQRLAPVAMMTLRFEPPGAAAGDVLDGIAHLDFFSYRVSVLRTTPLAARHAAADRAREVREELGIDHLLNFVEGDSRTAA